MYQKYLKISTVMIFSSLVCLSLILGCKNGANPLGPYDVPTATSTITATPTITSTPGPVNVSCIVNYRGVQTGVSWNLVDPNGNTLNATPQLTGGIPFLFTPTVYGIYSVNIPTQTEYIYSSQPLTIMGSGNYSVTFSCSGQTILASPSSLNYPSGAGYQMPVTVSYSYVGNLDVPVSIQTSGLASAFSVSPTFVILKTSNSSAPLTITKNAAYLNNTSLSFFGVDFNNLNIGNISNVSLVRNYSIPVTVSINENLAVYSNGSHLVGQYNSSSICALSFAYDSSLVGLMGVTIYATYGPGFNVFANESSWIANSSAPNPSPIYFSYSAVAYGSANFAASFFGSDTTPVGSGTWNFQVIGPTGQSVNYSWQDGGCNGVGGCTNSSSFLNNVVINY